MITTSRKYNIKFFFAEQNELIASDGTKSFSVHCRSLRSAEKEARKYADIIGGYFKKPTHCEITYNLKNGKTSKIIDFGCDIGGQR